MRIESKLCHITEDKAVVQVNGWDNEKNLGSALAEGPTVEIAEDRAISRLNKRLKTITNDVSVFKAIQDDRPNKLELPKPIQIDKDYPNNETYDWSNVLTEIDVEIERLKWSRDDENIFIEKNLGYNNRNKITNYSDIVKYLSLLKKITNNSKTRLNNGNINTLIEKSDILLRELSWDNIQGREYLQSEFNVSSRMELNERQLSSFVDKLKSITNEYLHK